MNESSAAETRDNRQQDCAAALSDLVRTERDAVRALDHAVHFIRDDARMMSTLAAMRVDHERHGCALDEILHDDAPPTSGVASRARTGMHVDAVRFANAGDTRGVLRLVKANLDLLVIRYRALMQRLPTGSSWIEAIRESCNDCLRHRAFIAATVAMLGTIAPRASVH